MRRVNVSINGSGGILDSANFEIVIDVSIDASKPVSAEGCNC